MTEQTLPDFQKLVADYQNKLTNGQRADLRRAEEPDALLDMPAFYNLVQRCGLKAGLQSGRIIYFLPYVKHKEGAKPIGRQMQEQHISETRLFQVIRAEFPDDLVYLRRLTQQMKPAADWQEFGKMLYFWGKNTKRQLLKDYFLKPQKDQ
ncbi:MAG: type I-E CRISPR-associated protein Cse2/CasB [Thermodesulfobacteriota bacterium]|nr:type I-E CRISPR-associated protein Cse2/CasB [Thermodesulfobacteriota bacterium]